MVKRLPQSIRKVVISEQGLLCQLCGSKEYLHIHHKDLSKTNHSLNNLIILCNSCHQKQHPRRRDGKFNGMYGKQQHPTTKELISKKAVERWKNGTWVSPTLGVGHTLETRKKMSAIAFKRWHREG